MARNDELAERFYENGEQIRGSITVQARAADVYQAWSCLRTIPRLIDCLKSVMPGAGSRLEFKADAQSQETSWVAEILREEPGHAFAWRTVGNPAIPNAGSVTLRELPFSRGTEVRVVIDYIPPGEPFGKSWTRRWVANPRPRSS